MKNLNKIQKEYEVGKANGELHWKEEPHISNILKIENEQKAKNWVGTKDVLVSAYWLGYFVGMENTRK